MFTFISVSFTIFDFLQIKEINPQFLLGDVFVLFFSTGLRSFFFFFYYVGAPLGYTHLAPLLGEPGVKLLSVSG